ncbi:MAG: GNAT family N-acetyltransferase [Actinomycetia bacterium]|nr:GNAT family N-acetyltransferase [Actinomycetes bacterium]
MKYQKLETARLILRKFESSDLNFVFNHFKDSFVSRYLYDNEPPKNLAEAQEILDWCIDLKSDHIRWCIMLKENSKPIGTIGFQRYDNQNNSAEIGYDLLESYSKMGIMTEVLKCIIEYGHKQFGLHRIHASVAKNNLASNKFLKKNGFHLEGIIRDQYFFRGKYYDHNLLSYIHSEKANFI